MGKKTHIEVETSKRSYSHLGDPRARVVWEKGEKIVRAEAREHDEKNGKK